MWRVLRLALELLDLSDSKEKPSLRKFLFRIVKWILAFTLVIIIISMGLGVWISENYL